MIGQSDVIKFILCGLFCFGIGVIFLNFMSSNLHQQSDRILSKNDKHIYELSQSISNKYHLIKADYKFDYQPIHNINKIDRSKILIKKYKISLNIEKEQDILVRECGKGKYKILLLHGRDFSSKIWEDIGTLQYLSKWGYRAYAIDIPNMFLSDQEAIQWLTNLINKLHLKNLVLISPSLSGRLTLPYIFQSNKQDEIIKGFVPIAPVGTNKYNVIDYKKIQIPTLIVHGEKDTKFQNAFDNLKQIPTSEILLIKNASHISYIEKSDEFHKALRQFLYNIYRPIYKNRYNLLPKFRTNKT